jgi:MFS family permease
MPDAAETAAAMVIEPRTTVSQRMTIYFYIGFLYFAWPFTGVWVTKAEFVLKDGLHLPADSIANFLFLVTIPSYLGFVFGFIRDRWGPFGRRDQGLLLLFCGLSAALLLFAAGLGGTYLTLFTVFIASGILGQFVGAAQRGLTSVMGQEHVMSGRISSVWQAASSAPGLIVSVASGVIAKYLSMQAAFLIAGAVAVAVTLFAFWRPVAVYDAAETAPIAPANLIGDARRLLRTPAIYPIVLLLLIWNFTPGAGTPMMFYLTDTLHGDARHFSNFNAIFGGCFIPGFLLFGFLCTRMNFGLLVWICTLIAVPQILPLLMVHNINSAMVAAIPMGLMGGPATAAYFCLLIRACPAGLQGTAMMLGASAWVLSDRLGNLAGSALYNHFKSFAPCAWATFFVYACLIPVLYFVPRHLLAARDGEVEPLAA